MRPETTITLNKSSFRADEAITGFVDIDINQSAPGEWDPKLWVVKVRLVGYAQMDTQWQEQAKNPDWQEKARYETVPIEECEAIVRSTEVPVYLKPGVANRVRSFPFRIQLSPANLIASFNAQKGLFLVDYLLTATTRRKCPKTGWNLLKLKTRTFVTVTPPEAQIARPLQVIPYSPPLDEMDLFRCPFMQTIRFNYSNHLTPTELSPSHQMSIYFPLPLYEPDEISLSLTTTLTLRHNQVVNRHTDTTLLPYETYYRPDSGGQEVLIDFDIPTKAPQTMDFRFGRGTMSLTHTLRVTMHATLFPNDRSKSSRRTWSVDLPVTIRGRHYVDPPPSPPASLITSPLDSGSPRMGRASLTPKDPDSEQSWIRDRFEMPDDSSDEETEPTSAVSATSSRTTSQGFLESNERTSLESDTSSRSTGRGSPKTRRQLRVINVDEIPPQKPAPTGPLPEPPRTAVPYSPSPRLSPEFRRPSTGERPKKRHSPERGDQSRSGKADLTNTVSFQNPLSSPSSEARGSPSPGPLSASSISTKSTMPPTPNLPVDVPSYYHSKPSYYLDKISTTTAKRPRAYTTGSTTSPLSPVSPSSLPSPVTPPMTKVKFTNPEVIESSTIPLVPKTSTQTSKLPFPRSPPESDFPFRAISPPPRKLSETESLISPFTTVPSTKKTSNYNSPESSRFATKPTPSRTSASHHSPTDTSRPRANSGPNAPKLSPVQEVTKERDSSGSSNLESTAVPPRAKTPINTVSVPEYSRLPIPRPPLPSQSNPRIVSMLTDTSATTKSSTSRAPTVSTAVTSRSASSTKATKITTKVSTRQRPANPSLFPPLPPATLQAATLGQSSRDQSLKSPKTVPTSQTLPSRAGRGRENWI